MYYNGLEFGPVPNKWGIGQMAIPSPHAQPPYAGEFIGNYVSMTPYMRGDFVPVYMQKPAKGYTSIYGSSYGGPITIGLQMGSRGAAVEDLQKALINLGYDVGGGGADGKFEDNTEIALMLFQNNNNLAPNGTVDSGTRKAIEEKLKGPPKPPTVAQQLIQAGTSLIPQIWGAQAPAAVPVSSGPIAAPPPPKTDYKPLLLAGIGIVALTGLMVFATRGK
jgi:hypothetical protein